MSSNQEHEYPALSLSAAWRILGGPSVDDLRLQHSAGTLVPALKAACTTRRVRAWDGDLAYKFSATLESQLSSVGQSAAGAAAALRAQKGNPAWDEEQRVSPQVYILLQDLPVVAQEDSEFWLYVTCVLLLPLLLEHKSVPPGKSRAGRLAGKHVGTPKQETTDDSEEDEEAGRVGVTEAPTREQRVNDILAKRMYLRGRIAAANPTPTSQKYTPLTNASETESSHILTGRTVRQHVYAEKLVARIRSSQASSATAKQRDLRKIVSTVLNVRKATKVVEVLSSTDLDDLLKDSGL